MKKAANTQNLQPWCLATALNCIWSAIPPGNPTEIFGWDFGTTGEETSSSPLPVWRALYKFMLRWLNTSAVQTPAIRLVVHTHCSQGSQRGCRRAQSSEKGHRAAPLGTSSSRSYSFTLQLQIVVASRWVDGICCFLSGELLIFSAT